MLSLYKQRAFRNPSRKTRRRGVGVSINETTFTTTGTDYEGYRTSGKNNDGFLFEASIAAVGAMPAATAVGAVAVVAASAPDMQRAPAATAGGSRVAEIEKLAELKAQGLLSDDEFTAAKAKVLLCAVAVSHRERHGICGHGARVRVSRCCRKHWVSQTEES